jgi:hypothetical protein
MPATTVPHAATAEVAMTKRVAWRSVARISVNGDWLVMLMSFSFLTALRRRRCGWPAVKSGRTAVNRYE